MKICQKLCITVLVLFLPWCVFAQQSAFEHFVSGIEKQQNKAELAQEGEELLNQSLTDPQRAYVLHRVALLHNKLGNFADVKTSLDALEQLLKDFSSDEYQGKLYITRGDLAINLGQFESAQEYFKQAIGFFESIQDYRMLSHTWRFYSFALKDSGQLSEALVAVEKAKEIAIKAENIPVTMAAYNAEAGIYNELNLPEKALKIQLELLEFVAHKAENPTNWYAQLYYSIGDSYAELKDHEKSLDAYTKAYEYDKKTEFFNYVGYDLIQMSRQLMALERFDQVPSLLAQALEIFTDSGNQRNIAWTQGNQAELLALTKKSEQAIDLFRTVLTSLDPVENKIIYQQFSLSYAQALIDTKQTKLAVQILEQLQENQLNLSSNHTLTNLLAKVYSDLGRHQDALKMKNQAYTLLQEKMRQEASSRALGYAAEARYQTSKIELAEIKSQQKITQLKNQQTVFVVGAIAVLCLLGLITLYIFHRQKRKLSIKEAQILSDSLHMKDQLLADVSHELRTPLTVLKLNIESLEHNLIEDPEATYKLLHTRLDSLNTLISDIYEMAQADSGSLLLEKEVYSLEQLVSRVADEVEVLINQTELSFAKQINIAKNAQIAVDMHRFNQVIYNLVRNSINYTDVPGAVELEVTTENNDVIIRLSDSSPSVADDELEQIFERLYRCDKSRSRDLGGSGLGLAISQKIIVMHKGKISATKSELGGITVTITLPLVN